MHITEGNLGANGELQPTVAVVALQAGVRASTVGRAGAVVLAAPIAALCALAATLQAAQQKVRFLPGHLR